MATPADLKSVAQIEVSDIVPDTNGMEVRMWLAPGCGLEFKFKQRRLIGPTGAAYVGSRA
jgi:hypothetical protein